MREAAIQTVVAFGKLNKRYGGQSPLKDTALAYHQHQPNEFSFGSTRSSESHRPREPSIQPDRKAPAKEEEVDAKAQSAVPEAKADAPSEDQEFGDLGMDEAAAPDHDHADEQEQEQETPSVPDKPKQITNKSSPLKQFVAKKRVQVSKLLQRKQIPRISPPKTSKPTHDFDFSPEAEEGDMSENREVDEEEDKPTAGDSSDCEEQEQDASESDELASMSRAEAALSAVQCEEYDLAIRLCLLEDDVSLLKQVMGVIGSPCMQELSRASRNALCAAFLEILDSADGGEDDSNSSSRHDQWLVFAWLRDLTSAKSSSSKASLFKQLDPRVLRALEARLEELSAEPTKAGLEAASVLAQLGL